MGWNSLGSIKGPQGDAGPAGGAADIASETTGSDAKTTPVDNDVVPLIDSESSFGLKKVSLGSLRTALAPASVIDGGSAATSTADVIDGGTA